MADANRVIECRLATDLDEVQPCLFHTLSFFCCSKRCSQSVYQGHQLFLALLHRSGFTIWEYTLTMISQTFFMKASILVEFIKGLRVPMMLVNFYLDSLAKACLLSMYFVLKIIAAKWAS